MSSERTYYLAIFLTISAQIKENRMVHFLVNPCNFQRSKQAENEPYATADGKLSLYHACDYINII